MQPVHDVDVLLLLALAISAKRRPATLVEVMAAIDLIHGAIPAEQKLAEAFSRLATHGLIWGSDGNFALTQQAQELLTELPHKGAHKGDYTERLFTLKTKLAGYSSSSEPDGGQAQIALLPEQAAAAVLAHRDAARGAGRNLLLPKPKPEEERKGRPGQRQRKPMPARRRG